MKTKFSAAVSAFFILHSAFGQGALTPQGAPAPTMKTLDQMEPRTPISTLPFNIVGPGGSYYLTTNLTGSAGLDGIVIAAENVTLDLNGYAVLGVPGTARGIIVAGANRKNIRVFNGTVRDWGNQGIEATGAVNGQFSNLRLSGNSLGGLVTGPNCRLTELSCHSNGIYGIQAGAGSVLNQCQAFLGTSNGIVTGDGSTLIGCSSVGNKGFGMGGGANSTFTHCLASSNFLEGIQTDVSCTVTACTATTNRYAGILVGEGSTVQNCTAGMNGQNGIRGFGPHCVISGCAVRNNSQAGIDVYYSSKVTGCQVSGSFTQGITTLSSHCMFTGNSLTDNGAEGIYVAGECVVADNHCENNGLNTFGKYAGIHAQGSGNRIDNNMCAGNVNRGIWVEGNSSLVTRNYCFNQATNYVVVGLVGPICDYGVMTNHPWANFQY